jgi:gamma-glutamylputrescine oxidase
MTRTRYGESPWVQAFPKSKRLEFPRFSAPASRPPASMPAVIVGGGLAGCCTAYALAAAGVKVVLLEADRIGLGGSSRGPGILQGEAASSFRELNERVGRRAARAMFDASRRAVLELAATARRLGIKHAIETGGAFRLVSPYGGDEKALARELAERRDAGLDGVWVRGAAASREAGIERLSAGARFHDWGQADPYRLVMGFAAAALDRGAQIFERSPVRRIKFTRKHAVVQTQNGALQAGTVIVCTGEPTDLFRSLKRHVHFQERYVVLTDRLPGAVRKQMSPRARLLADDDVPPHVVRWTADERVAIAGADQARTPERGREKVLVQRTGQLMYELSRLYPAISGVMPEYGWSLPLATTADGAMYAGPHRNYPHHLFAWATRHDPAQAFLASRVLLRHVLGEAERDDAYFAFTRG